MFIPRLISGIALVIIALITVNMGGLVLLLINLFISLVGMMEMYRVFGVHKRAVCAAGYGLCIFFYACLWFECETDISLKGGVTAFLFLMTFYVAAFPKYKTEEVMAVIFGCIYPGILLSFLYQLANLPEGSFLVWLIFLSSWGSDTCAYCAGNICKKLGKTHAMTPVLSPKKSIEGGVGGLAGAALLGFVFGICLNGRISTFIIPAPAACALLCFLGGIVSMLGDLAASAVKRNHGIKDYGRLIPGHGGIMDRFDSIVFSAPFLYIVTCILQSA